MIPKKIHYCWFGGNSLPDIAKKCIESWKFFCPDYEIVCWDETNCDLKVNTFVQQAAENKKWAFVSDYFRLKIVYECGGIYLDIDVELLKPLDDLLKYDGYMGFELSDKNYINSGLGFGAIPNNDIIRKLKENYEDIPFIMKDGSFDMKPCPKRDTEILVHLGLKQNNQTQMLGNFIFYSSDYFSPIGFNGQKLFSVNTYSIHHFNSSWLSENEIQLHNRKKTYYIKYGKNIGIIFFKFHYYLSIIKKDGILFFLKAAFKKLWS